jgi:hypothetical protein
MALRKAIARKEATWYVAATHSDDNYVTYKSAKKNRYKNVKAYLLNYESST